MAETYWTNRSPLGECLEVNSRCHRIVGVFDDIRSNVAAAPKPRYVIAVDPRDYNRWGVSLLARFRRSVTDDDVARIHAMLGSLIGPTRMQFEVARPGASFERQLKPWRIAASLLSAFGLVALASAAAGVFGLVAYDVGRRQREIGIRTALGATPSRVVRDVIRPSLKVIGVGIVIGAGIALMSGRVVASLLFNTSPTDPAVLVSAAGALGLVALIAGFIPALRAARLNPVGVLNAD